MNPQDAERAAIREIAFHPDGLSRREALSKLLDIAKKAEEGQEPEPRWWQIRYWRREEGTA